MPADTRHTVVSNASPPPAARPLPADPNEDPPTTPTPVLAGLRLTCSGFVDVHDTQGASDALTLAEDAYITDLDAFKAFLHQHGARVDEVVTRRTNLVVVWRGLTRKRLLADRHGIPVVSPRDLLMAVHRVRRAGAAHAAEAVTGPSLLASLPPPPPLLEGYVFSTTQLARAEGDALSAILEAHGARLSAALTARCDALLLSSTHAAGVADALRRLPPLNHLVERGVSAGVGIAAPPALADLRRLSSSKVLFAWAHDIPVLSYDKLLSLAGIGAGPEAAGGLDFDTIVATARLEVEPAVRAQLVPPHAVEETDPCAGVGVPSLATSPDRSGGEGSGSEDEDTETDGDDVWKGEKNVVDKRWRGPVGARYHSELTPAAEAADDLPWIPLRPLHPPLMTICFVGCTGRELRDGTRMALASRFLISPVPCVDVDVVVVGRQVCRRQRVAHHAPSPPPPRSSRENATPAATSAPAQALVAPPTATERPRGSPPPPLRAIAAAAQQQQDDWLRARRVAHEAGLPPPPPPHLQSERRRLGEGAPSTTASMITTTTTTFTYVYEIPRELADGLRDHGGIGLHRIAPMAWLRACYRLAHARAVEVVPRATYGFSETFAGGHGEGESVGEGGMNAGGGADPARDGVARDHSLTDDDWDSVGSEEERGGHHGLAAHTSPVFDPRPPIPPSALPPLGVGVFCVEVERLQPTAFGVSTNAVDYDSRRDRPHARDAPRAGRVLERVNDSGGGGARVGDKQRITLPSSRPVATKEIRGSRVASDEARSTTVAAPPPSLPPPPPPPLAGAAEQGGSASAPGPAMTDATVDDAAALAQERRQAAALLRSMLHRVTGEDAEDAGASPPPRVFAGCVVCVVDGAFTRVHLAAVRALVRHGGGTCLKLSDAQWRRALSSGEVVECTEEGTPVDTAALARVRQAVARAKRRRAAGSGADNEPASAEAESIPAEGMSVMVVHPQPSEASPTHTMTTMTTTTGRSSTRAATKPPLRHLPTVTSDYLLACLAAGARLAPGACPLFHTPLPTFEEVQLRKRLPQEHPTTRATGGEGASARLTREEGRWTEWRPPVSPWLHTRRYEKEASVGVCVCLLWLVPPPPSAQGQGAAQTQMHVSPRLSEGSVTDALVRIARVALTRAVECLGGALVAEYSRETVTHALVVDVAAMRGGQSCGPAWPASVRDARRVLRDESAGSVSVVSMTWLLDSLHWGVFVAEVARDAYDATPVVRRSVRCAARVAGPVGADKAGGDRGSAGSETRTSTPVRASPRRGGDGYAEPRTPELAGGGAFHFHTPGRTPRPSEPHVASPTPSQPGPTPRRRRTLRQASSYRSSCSPRASVMPLAPTPTPACVPARALGSDGHNSHGRSPPHHRTVEQCDPWHDEDGHCAVHAEGGCAEGPPALVLSSADPSLSQPPAMDGPTTTTTTTTATTTTTWTAAATASQSHLKSPPPSLSDGRDGAEERHTGSGGALPPGAGLPRLARAAAQPRQRHQEAVDVSSDADEAVAEAEKSECAVRHVAKAGRLGKVQDAADRGAAETARRPVLQHTADSGYGRQPPQPLRVYVIGDLPHREELVQAYVDAVAALPAVLPTTDERAGAVTDGNTGSTTTTSTSATAVVAPVTSATRGRRKRGRSHETTACSGSGGDTPQDPHRGPLLLLHDAVEGADCLVTHELTQRETVLAAIAAGLWVVRPEFLVAVAERLRRDPHGGADALVGGRHSRALTSVLAWHEWTVSSPSTVLPGGTASPRAFSRALAEQCRRRRRERESAGATSDADSVTCRTGRLFEGCGFVLLFPATPPNEAAESSTPAPAAAAAAGVGKTGGDRARGRPAEAGSRLARRQSALLTVLRSGGGRIAYTGEMTVTLDDPAGPRDVEGPARGDNVGSTELPAWLEPLTRAMVRAVARGRPTASHARPQLRHEALRVLLDANLLPRAAGPAVCHPLRRLLAAVAEVEKAATGPGRGTDSEADGWPRAARAMWHAVDLARRRLLTEYAIAVARATSGHGDIVPRHWAATGAEAGGWAETLVQSVWQEEEGGGRRPASSPAGTDGEEVSLFTVPSSLTVAEMACVALEVAGMPAYTEESTRFFGCVNFSI